MPKISWMVLLGGKFVLCEKLGKWNVIGLFSKFIVPENRH